MNKKLILSIIILIQVIMLLFVASYAWFEGEYRDKKINNNDIVVSTSEDLIMSYKNKTYNALNLNNLVGENFVFAQVTSTGISNSEYYKIDYTKELEGLPVEYTTAVANKDYIEFTISLSTASKGKRIYIDSVNSGFFQTNNDVNKTAANCMRCSLSFVDAANNARTIVFANQNKYFDVIHHDDFIVNDGYGNPTYSGGEELLNKIVEGDGGVSATGIQSTNMFSLFDFVDNKENNILFDLQPYQIKMLNIRIWLEGEAVPSNLDDSMLVSGQMIQFALRFSSTTEMNSLYEYREVEKDTIICPVKKYLGLSGSNNISLKYFEYDYENINPVDDEGFEYDNLTGYYYNASNNLYYDIENHFAYVPYSALDWKLSNVSKVREGSSNVTIATIGNINNDYQITIGNNARRDEIFNLIGYYTLEDDTTEVVVNECYTVFDQCKPDKEIIDIQSGYKISIIMNTGLIQVKSGEELVATYNIGNNVISNYYTIYNVSSGPEYMSGNYIFDMNTGMYMNRTYTGMYCDVLTQKAYYKYSELDWNFNNISKVNNSGIAYDCLTNITNQEVDGSLVMEAIISPSAFVDDTFNLVGQYTVGGNTYVVVNILFVVEETTA